MRLRAGATLPEQRCRFVAPAATFPALLFSEPADSKRKPRTTPTTSSRRLGFRASRSA
jgi:hypothetical protein